MGKVKQAVIKNWTYYFYNDMILKISNRTCWKSTKKHYKGIDIYYIGYITIKKIGDCENIYSLKPFYLLINQARGYIEENHGNKYLIFDDSVNENKWLLEKYVDVWDGIKNEMTIIIRSVFKGGGKLYLQVFLDDALYEL